jgi:3-phosphoshikimate 1-carboxyvinyltransferase
MITISPKKLRNQSVEVPGSKSYTHRMLIAAALSDGQCMISNGLDSDDTRLTLAALNQMGTGYNKIGGQFGLDGNRGRLAPRTDPIYLGNSGTSMRLITAVAALGRGKYLLTGSERMTQRPIQDLLDALIQIGVSARAVNQDGCPPVEVIAGAIKGGETTVNCQTSSQYLSALMLIAPYTQKGLRINVSKGPVSKPYVDMTIEVMQRMGVEVSRQGYTRFDIEGGQVYRSGMYAIEPDCSQAGYFWAAGAITGATIKVSGITRDTRQGDVNFTKVLKKMGCTVDDTPEGIAVSGGRLEGIDVDMGDMPDLVPTLAVVAAFAKGKTRIRDVAHLRAKESDRLTAVATELGRMGINVTEKKDGLNIVGGRLKGAVIKTYDDHRIAMSFAIAGLVAKGVKIEDEKVVAKSFPNFWEVFEDLQDKRM